MKPGDTLREGDVVLVGTAFGRTTRGVVAADWDGGESMIQVVYEGRAKPRPIAPSRVRPAERPAPPPAPTLERAPSTEANLRAVPRALAPARDERYLRFVRTKACMHCRAPAPSESHHWAPSRGIAQKPSDYRTVPLCTECHQHFHDHGVLRELDKRTTFQRFAEVMVDLLDEWCSRRLLRERAERAKGATA